MPIIKYKPTSPGRRGASVLDYSELSKKAPEKSLLRKLSKTGGRNHHGHITSRRRGGGHKRMYRVIDFKRNKLDIPARVAALEYDPNRSAHIALLHYADGEKRYILAPRGLVVGDTVLSGEMIEPAVGNAMPLENIPPGFSVHNIEMVPGGGGKLVRSAGVDAKLMAIEGKWAHISLPSGEIRKVNVRCRATIGTVGNKDHQLVKIGKAGRNRHKGRRPKVRGVAMNPVAHPMGGGEGRSAGGRHPCSPWGKPSKGGKTRNKKKPSNKQIVRKRKKKRRR